MRHKVVWVGRKAACPFLQAAADYQQRLKRLAPTDLAMVRQSDREQEAKGLLAASQGAQVCIALDPRGQQHSTESLVAYFRAQTHVSEIVYLIGGADGFASSVYARVDAKWSLSALTLPHRLALAMWLEQLYRVHTVLAGQTYHRA